MRRGAPALILLLAVMGLIVAPAGCRRAPLVAGPAGAPPRIAALAPAIAVILRDMGYESFIVARHGFDEWTNPALPVVGDQAGIDYEALIRARPTHVLLQWGERPMPARLIDLSLEHKWAIKSYPLLTLDDIRAAILDLADRFRVRPPVPETHVRYASENIIADWDRVMTTAGGLRPDHIGKVLILYGASPPAALGPGSYHHQILERLGAPSVFAPGEGSPFVPLDAEDFIRLAPECIILVQPRAPGAAPAGPPPAEASLRAAWLRQHLGPLAGLPVAAIGRCRVLIIDDPLGLVPGTNLIRVAEAMREALTAWSHGAGVPHAPPPAAP